MKRRYIYIYIYMYVHTHQASQVVLVVKKKNLPANAGDLGSIPG